MKHNTLILACVVSLFAGFGINRVSAQVVAADDASAYVSSAAFTNGSTGGFGFAPWVFTQTNVSGSIFGGKYLDVSSLPISVATKTWGVYGNGSVHPGPFSFIYRGMSNALAPNEVFKVKAQVSGMNTSATSPGYVGFVLRTDSNTNFADQNIIDDPNTMFAFYNVGNVDDCYFWDANGATDTGVAGNPITEQILNKGITIELYLLTANTYQLVIKDATDTTVLGSYPVSTLTSSGNIVTFAGFEINNNGGQNMWFNSLEVASVSVVPPIISGITPTNAATYVPTDTAITFDVTSMFSTVSSNGVKLILNGINESNQLSFTGSGTGNLQVSMNGPLQPNVLYNGTISAVDTNGNLSTSTFSFNTWLTSPNNIYVESGDYNYGAGQWVNNFTTPQPNQNYGQFDLLGTNGIDYFVFTPLLFTNYYRPGDMPALETNLDYDHNEFAANGFQAYDLAFNLSGQWEDYTRELSNSVTYAVYARMAGFTGGGTMALSRMATAEVSSSNQPDADLGTFVCPDSGGTQNYTFVPLKDFFSNPVLINSGGTNTFRITDLGPSSTYNLGYLVFVAVTNTGTIRPYLSSGFPYPGATGVNPGTLVHFMIANGQTSVNPGSIQLFLNSNNVTGSLAFNNNAAGTAVSYQPSVPNLLQAGTNNAEVIFSDGSVTLTNTWQFTVETVPVLPSSWAVPLSGSFSRGFFEQIAKGDDSATNTDFKPSVARAVAQLAGTLTNSLTGLPYANEALNGGTNIELNTINYAVDSQFPGIFTPTSAFPDIPLGETNNVAMAADMYAYLTPGVYNFVVYSDDGFEFTAGSTPTSTNVILGAADFGRAATGTEFSFIVTNTGLYPMQLIYFKSQEGGGGVELYSTGSSGNILLNYSGNPAAVPVYYKFTATAPVPALNISLNGNHVVLTWKEPNVSLESAPVVTGPYTIIPGATSPWPVPVSGTQQYFQLVPTP